jgi:CheY-like chemotaxis protein
MNPRARVLIVDDDSNISQMMARALSRNGFDVEAVESASEALPRFDATACDAAVLDLLMPDHDGVELAMALRQRSPGLPIAFLTGYVNSPLLKWADKAAVRVFSKPMVIQEIVDFLRHELQIDRDD